MTRTRLPLVVAGVVATVVFELLAIVQGQWGDKDVLLWEVDASVDQASVVATACGHLRGIHEVRLSITVDLLPDVPAEHIYVAVEGRAHAEAVEACVRGSGGTRLALRRQL